MYTYTAWQWMLVFFLYCFLGWCFETTVVSVQQRRFVNRGFLRGPMLPIYGFGAILLLHIALPLRGRYIAVFLLCMAAATIFEYIVGALMEKLFKVKYWDYSTHRFQFQGRICLQSSLCWGAMGLVLDGIVHPPIERLIFSLPFGLVAALVVLFTVLFAGDVYVSVRAALDFAKVLEEFDHLREQSAALREQLSETALVRLTALSYRVDEARGEWGEKMDAAKELLADRAEERRERMGEVREQLFDRLAELQKNFDERAEALARVQKSMLRGNPTATSAKYDDVLQRLKKHTGKKRGR